MSELSASNMFEAQTVLADHKDLIHDIAYDFYGERMATCSSDHYVKIWDADAQGNWKLTASWKAHHGSVWKVTWSHPEFGQVIATCSFDRTAAVWEEVGEIPASGTEKGLRTWVKRSNLVDSRTSVTDVKFGPKHLGLLLVTCSADGIIRIYEAPDVMNLAQWTLQHEIPTKVSISCLSWNPSMSRYNPPMLAVGSDEPGPAAVSVQNDKGPLCNGKVFIYEYTESARRWTRTECLSQCAEAVNDLAFAPNLGRAFHVLAVASRDVRIIKIEPTPTSTESQPNGSTTPAGRFKVSVMAAFDDHRAAVWRVAWNVTGTLLASSGDDCRVRLWKMQYLNQFRCVGVLKNGSPGDERPAAGGSTAGAGGSAGGQGGSERGHTSYVRMAAMDNPAHMPVH